MTFADSGNDNTANLCLAPTSATAVPSCTPPAFSYAPTTTVIPSYIPTFTYDPLKTTNPPSYDLTIFSYAPEVTSTTPDVDISALFCNLYGLSCPTAPPTSDQATTSAPFAELPTATSGPSIDVMTVISDIASAFTCTEGAETQVVARRTGATGFTELLTSASVPTAAAGSSSMVTVRTVSKTHVSTSSLGLEAQKAPTASGSPHSSGSDRSVGFRSGTAMALMVAAALIVACATGMVL
ncbi:hypothetical protein LTR50_003667 [Elasticomyces elasticus]|nr:hypothetical protein LTR50_003667 [Elasticomyces elasticus]